MTLPTPDARDRDRTRAIRRALLVVLLLNALVVAIKVVVCAGTRSLAVFGAALESGLDMLNNVGGMVLVSIAARGPDEDHPYGHAKFESMGTVGIVVFLSISCFELLRSSIGALIHARAPRPAGPWEFGLMIFTLAINFWVVWYERRRARALGSAFLSADAAHTASDTLVTLLALAALLFTRAGWPHLDAWLGIAVAGLIAWTGWLILRESVPFLVDARGMDAAELRAIATGVAGILSVRTVRSRGTPTGKLFVEMTVVVPGASSVLEGHALADAVEEAVARVAEGAEVVVHVEPE
ncbi:MAG TPA: cation diffusion facilitator family transporter [Gemmatimonadaceae bacterium]|jgi:cation diffusion facilitator family transporter|nr:cation diffusion facilitator family transporter [Gemmatimonadaceae bacterium]